MSRTRQVFPREEVAHLWAHRAQDSARDKSGNFFFTGAGLYSYGSHFCIAYILGDEVGPELSGRVLWNGATYSNTTSKMQSIAWRALTRQQRETVLTMPGSIGMCRNVDPYRIERALKEKRLPDICDALASVIVECVAGLRGKRYGSGPFESLIAKGYQAEKILSAFYARAGKKYPLPRMETRPESSNKEEWRAWIRAISLGKMRADYAAAVKNGKEHAARAEEMAAESCDVYPFFSLRDCEWAARLKNDHAYNHAKTAVREFETARKLYADINGKPGPVSLKKPAARMEEIAAVFAARSDEFKKREIQSRVIRDIREGLIFARDYKGNPRNSYRWQRFADLETLATRAEECGLSDSLHSALAVRLSRIGAAFEAARAVKSARQEMETARSFWPNFPRDAARHSSAALRRLEWLAGTNIAPRLRARLDAECVGIREEAARIIGESEEMVRAKNAETLRAWLAGESDVRPEWGAGTFARIKGEIVETTRGARVPVAHACRLSRLYAGIVRRGGQEWKDGAGPIVGHYRVNRIGADGSLVIGCHEFDASEAARLHAILQECAACNESADSVA